MENRGQVCVEINTMSANVSGSTPRFVGAVATLNVMAPILEYERRWVNVLAADVADPAALLSLVDAAP